MIPSSTSTCTSTCRTRVLITPFHNMVLMCPETTIDDVDLHGRVFEEAVAALWDRATESRRNRLFSTVHVTTELLAN